MPKRVKIVFLGEVIRIEHRFFIKQKAIELGLKGYCNLNDALQLEVEVEGSINAVDEFIHFAHKRVNLQTPSNRLSLEVFESLKYYKEMKSDMV